MRIPGKNIPLLTRVTSIFSIAVILSLQFACNPTKYVPENQYLLHKNKLINADKKAIGNKELKSYLRQQPNKRILGIRFNLGLYNLSNLDKDKGFQNWLRKVGEPPVIFDINQNMRSVSQLKQYLDRKGYFDALVYDSTYFNRKKANVEYHVFPNSPYRIRHVSSLIKDSVLTPYIQTDSSNSLLYRGLIYDVDRLDDERSRVEKLLKDRGFYRFQKDRINYIADSTIGDGWIDIEMVVESQQRRVNERTQQPVSYQKYRVRNVYFFVDYDPAEALRDPSGYYSDLDTLQEGGYYFIKKNISYPLNNKTVTRGNYILPGSMYNLTNVQQTRKHLGGLNIIKYVDIFFTDVTREPGDTGALMIDCHIQMAQNKKQSYSFELEGTNSSGNFGASINFLYQHRNLLKRAEVFNLKLKYGYEALPSETEGFGSLNEVGVEGDITFPRFLLPFLKKDDFVKKFAPKTTLFSAYNYQKRPEYERNMAIVNFGYHWKGNAFVSHIVTPIDLNVIKLPYIDSAWAVHIDTTSYLAYSYKNTFIAGLNYSLIYTNQDLRKNRDHFFLRFNVSTSGNLVSALDYIFNENEPKVDREVFGIPYAQFILTDIDFRYNLVINQTNSLVYRGFFGVGFPYGNSRAIPFVKQYYTGGANDIRAWPARALGPGSHVVDNTGFYNQRADLKINANMEYRFKLFWILEGALFVDAGNIWAVSPEDDREGARFSLNSLVGDLAVGTGFGTRFDFSFFIFRLDFGFKLRDPQIQSGSKWIVGNPGYSFNEMTFHLAIGYPF